MAGCHKPRTVRHKDELPLCCAFRNEFLSYANFSQCENGNFWLNVLTRSKKGQTSFQRHGVVHDGMDMFTLAPF